MRSTSKIACLLALGALLPAAGCVTELESTTDEVLVPGDQALHETSTPGTQVVYVNFDGVRVSDCDGFCSDATANRSWAIGQHFGRSAISFSAYGGGSSSRRTVLDIIRTAMEPYDVFVTDRRPSDGEYTMVIISAYQDGPNHGVAPLDCDNGNARDIAFVYRTGGLSAQWVGQAAVHELGHSFGLSHVTSDGDFMHWASRGDRFTSSRWDEARSSFKCTPGNVQDAPATLRANLGSHTHEPIVFDGTFADDDGNVHEDAIERLAAARITVGCRGGEAPRFCPNDDVTRGQMAVFLTRALGLRASGVDHFTDDNGMFYESSANAMYEAGITSGCGTTGRYCGEATVTREQMAAFLSRALELPAASRDYFSDDAQSQFESSINRIAEAGVTRGCNPPANTNYCPDSPVTRAQMATFLVRAFNL